MKRSLTLTNAARAHLRHLPARLRIRAGEALLSLAAADDPEVPTIAHPDDPFVRHLRGVGFVCTVLLYDHRVVAVSVRPD
ncbi:hypothetical protein PWG71_15775 [Nocardiopsis sp. N85]|uniref:hypothetical protein n=1 Tax=Nocardiopsis sp. N85 TaxID=3029400 RepID=UPI00237FA9D7|nr:hypothetical protein [Nocardiopsis sp. N85]MDE3722848.1 hypothetical protein [Nocardiopsis sp. N85]